MTAITNAARLYEFPLGVFGIAIATAIFPALARQNNDAAAFAATLRRGLRVSLFIGLPASAGLLLVSREAVGVLFQRGAFDEADTVRVAWVLAAFAPGIWAYQSVHILSRAFYALKKPMRPVRIAVAMVAAVAAVGEFVPSGLVQREMLVALAAKVAVGAGVFALAARVLRMPELGWAIGSRASQPR